MAQNPDMRQRDAASVLHGKKPFRPADNSPSRRHFATHRGLLCLILISSYAFREEKARKKEDRPQTILFYIRSDHSALAASATAFSAAALAAAALRSAAAF